MSSTILFLTVAYKNGAEVCEFIDHTMALAGSQAFHFAVCDNSPQPQAELETLRELHHVTLVRREDNPGYLEGALLGLDAYRSAHDDEPAWAFITNTDLEFESSDLVEVLNGHDPDEPVVLAPDIREGSARFQKNPHVFHRRPQWRHQVNRFANATPLTSYLYQRASELRLQRRLRDYRPRTEVEDSALRGTTFYSPYGAQIIFSSGFFRVTSLPRFVPLMTEEWLIAEVARDAGIPVVYEPDIRVLHEQGTATGKGASLGRGRMLANGFKYIARGRP